MNIRRALFPALISTVAIAFENEAKWKTLDGGGIAADSDGNPILLAADGSETTVQVDTVPRLSAEAKRHRTAAETAAKELKKFEGLDPTKAREAIEATKDINLADMVGKDKLDEVRREVAASMQAEIDTAAKERDDMRAENNNLRLETAFSKSTFLNERLAVPRDFIEAKFKDRFKVEDGKVIPLHENGEPMSSKKNHGEIASVDEAFEIIVSSRPDKDSLLKAAGAGGSGSQGGGGNRGGGNTMRRSEFDALGPNDRATVGAKLAKQEITLVDG